MTRQEFIDEINDIYDLMSFVYEYGYEHIVEYVYSQDSYSDWVWENIHDWGGSWEELQSWLYNLPETRDFDYFDISDEPCGIGDYEFERYKSDLIDALDYDDYWEDADEVDDDNNDANYVINDEPPKTCNQEERNEFITLLTA